MEKSKDIIVSKSRINDLNTSIKDIGKTKVKIAKTAKKLKKTSKEKGKIGVKVGKTAQKLKATAKEIGKTKTDITTTATKIMTASKGSEKIIIKLVKGVEKLKTKAKVNEKLRIKTARGATKLKATAKKKEEKRFKLIEIAKDLAKTASVGEVVRIRMAKKARQLSKIAKYKESSRIQLANIAEQKEDTRIQLAKTAVIIKDLSDRNEAILSSIGDAAFACNKQGIITLFNKMAEEITGIDKKDAIGIHHKKVTIFVNEKTGKPAIDFISEAIKEKKKTGMELDTLLVKKNGTKVPVADTAAPIFDSSGEVTGCVVVFRDVSKERSIDRAKTELVSLSSHQLRTPLTAIGWYVELLESKAYGELTAKQLKLTKEIRAAHNRMTTLVNSLLNVSRIEMGTYAVEPKHTNIKVVLDATIELFKRQIDEKHLTFNKSCDEGLKTFFADPKILSVIFQNLISNAVKYTADGGTIIVRIKKKKSFEMSVSDTGIGIPKYQQPKIFSKLFRADNANSVDPNGTGLGLYIIHEIVKASGGTIRFESQVGKGTTFIVNYPLTGMVKKAGEKGLI